MIKKGFIKSFLSILFITFFFVAPINTFSNGLIAHKGVLDLSRINLTKAPLVNLQGEWEIYWNQLLNPGNIDEIGKVSGNINIPGKWTSVKIKNTNLKGKGFVTIRLKVLLSQEYTDCGFKFYGIESAYKVFLNGKEIYISGLPWTDKKVAIPGLSDGYVTGIDLKKENDIIIQISNYELLTGVIKNILLGTSEKVFLLKSKRSKTDLFLFGSIFIMALYHLGLFFIRKQNKSALFFGIFCILLAFRTLIVGDKILLENINLSWNVIRKFEFLTYYIAAPTFLYFAKSIFSKKLSKRYLDIFTLISLIFVLVVIFSPASFYTYTLNPYQVLTAITGIYITYVSVKSIKKKKSESVIFLIGWLFLFIAVINDILYENEILLLFDNLTSVGLFVFIIFQAFLLALEFSKAVYQSEKLAKKLNYTNRNLTNIVNYRTSELEKQKQDLFFQKAEIEHKNKDITDSLNYASKIQTAVLPEYKKFKDCFDDIFIYYAPKDIVSGDFYWVKRIRSKIIVAAADCTGHGVPGAFMSLLGMAFLNEIVNMLAYMEESGDNIRPNIILDELRDRIKDALKQTGDIDEAFDGIDMAICILDYVESKLYYSGANNSVYLVCEKSRNVQMDEELLNKKRIIPLENEEQVLFEVKANRMPIGAYLAEQPFTSYEFNLEDIGLIYMFSDGFPDQLGGENTTKFRQKRFKQLILDNANKPMDEQHKILRSTMDEWMDKDVGQIDDITVVGIKIHADREERSFGLF